MKEFLKEHHISMLRFWNATLVGPNIRRFLAAYVTILEAFAAKKSASKGASTAAEFTATHSRMLEQLQVMSHLTLTTDVLSALQLNQLELACASFGEAFRLSYPNQMLAVKGHIVELTRLN
jgi:hypothetical protein